MPLKETTFIEANLKKWEALERELARSNPNPEKLQRFYEDLIDDLSYANTHYKNRSIREYLNDKMANLSISLKRNKPQKTNYRFFIDTLPIEVYRQRIPMLISFLVFLFAFLVGAYSSSVDIDFSNSILSEGYVEMTKANIESGDPMAVYKGDSMLGSALRITTNNILVALRTFVSGVLFGIGAVLIILYNGVMVGAFQYFFFDYGVGVESMLSIWTHGTIEITAIVLSGGAGLALSRSIIAPGTYSRMNAFQAHSLSAIRIMFGLIPYFIIAGFIEGFITRMTHLPDAIRALFIFANIALVVIQFIYLPYLKGKEGIDPIKPSKLQPSTKQTWDTIKDHSIYQLLLQSLSFFHSLGSKILRFIFLFSAVMALLYAFSVRVVNSLTKQSFISAENFNFEGNTNMFWLILLASFILFPTLTTKIQKGLPNALAKTKPLSFVQTASIGLVWAFCYFLVFRIGNLAYLIIPMVLLFLRCITDLSIEGTNVFSRFSRYVATNTLGNTLYYWMSALLFISIVFAAFNFGLKQNIVDLLQAFLPNYILGLPSSLFFTIFLELLLQTFLFSFLTYWSGLVYEVNKEKVTQKGFRKVLQDVFQLQANEA